MDDSKLENRAIAEKKDSNTTKSFFEEFTESTSLHGLRYIGEKGNSTFERTLWISVISISFGICSYFIAQVWIRWNDFPVIVTIGETELSIRDIPFPMVTICPMQVLRNSSFLYKGSCDRNLNESEIFEYQSISLLCKNPYTCHKTNFTNQSSIDVFNRVGLIRDDFIAYIKYNKHTEYDVKLNPTLTPSGICYSFNMMDINHIYKEEVINYESLKMPKQFESSDWNLDKGYKDKLKKSVYPHRVMGTGYDTGLSILLHRNRTEIEDRCSWIIEGFKISFNLPNSPPQFDHGYIWITLNYFTQIAIEPKMITTSEDLRKYEPKKFRSKNATNNTIVFILRRQCYFENERSLKFFQTYTQENCEAECFANLTLKSCDCVPFYAPRFEGTKICSLGKEECTREVLAKIHLLAEDGQANVENNDDCHCLPGCIKLKYTPILHQVPFNFSKDEKMADLGKEYDFTSLKVYFETSQFITSKRSELYGIAEFIANCGGLLGLYLGFSLLSLVELIYFIVFRVCRSRKNVDNASNETNHRF